METNEQQKYETKPNSYSIRTSQRTVFFSRPSQLRNLRILLVAGKKSCANGKESSEWQLLLAKKWPNGNFSLEFYVESLLQSCVLKPNSNSNGNSQ